MNTSISDTPNFSMPCPAKVAWGPIIAGIIAAAAVSLILLVLGSAFGLSSTSIWASPESVSSFTIKTAIWLIVMQWISSGLGGYLTGRLRAKWNGMHNDEIYFRDTAHGFLAWAGATLLTATVLASATSAIIGTGVQATAAIAAGAAAKGPGPRPPEGGPADANGYYIDSLFRANTPSANAPAPEVRGEVTRLLMVDLKNGAVPDEDRAYLTNVVAARAGISKDEAAQRVDNTITQLNTLKEKVKADAEQARKTAMHVSIYIALSLLIGAFIASAAAALGGVHRDEY